MNVMQLARPISGLALGLALATSGCIVYEEPGHHHQHRGSDAYEPAETGGSVLPVPSEPAPPSAPSPMLVEVDADKVMDVVAGDGVGVFIEYGTGGHWHLSWTCDTTHTRQSCDFSISASAATGDITNVDATELTGGLITSPTTSRVDMTSTTTTEKHGVRFDTSPGAVVTVDAAVGGLKDGAFLFFVQDGKVNGGFTGKLTNPLQVQGNTP